MAGKQAKILSDEQIDHLLSFVATTRQPARMRLPREQFADLLIIIAARQLAEVELLLEGLSRGEGAVRSVSFHTEPVPSERGEDTDEAQP